MKHLLSLLSAAVLSAVILLSGCAAPQPISKTGFCLNTTCTVTLYDTEDEALLDGAFARIEHYENLFSKTVEGSDISRINQAEGAPVAVDPETAELLRAAISYSELTGGKFDVTIGRVSSLWDFTSESPVPPSKEAVAEALAPVGSQNLSVEGNTVTVPAGTQLDLGLSLIHIWYQTAASIQPDPNSGGFTSPDCYNFIPYLQLCVCYDRMGEHKTAEKYHRKARRLKPADPSVRYNDRYFKSLHKPHVGSSKQ